MSKSHSALAETVTGRKVVVMNQYNPNPKKFFVIQKKQIGDFCILLVKYPDCKNFEGIKVMVFEGDALEISKAQILDPHFSDKAGALAPVARFVPTPKGWFMAETLCRLLMLSEESRGDAE